MSNLLLFKVLVDGQSCHGGNGKYPTIGEWTDRGSPNCCTSGWHLTSDPLRWWIPRASLWLAEGDGLINGDNSDKAAFECVRLVEEITLNWKYLVMFPRLRCFLAASARSINKDANISWANLSWADLSGANLSRADLSGADLSGANLSRANLSWADLSRANLSKANLSWANLSWANLSWANLSWADLSGANLSRADLSGANLSRAYRLTNPPDGWTPNDNGYLQRSPK